MSVVNFVIANKVAILACLLGLSEGLSLIPGIKANGVFQAIVNGLKTLASKFGTPA